MPPSRSASSPTRFRSEVVPVKPASFYVLAEYRLRANAIGSFVTREEADEYRATLPQGGKGWHVVPVEQPALTVTQLGARLVRSGFFSGSGPFEDDPTQLGREDVRDSPSDEDIEVAVLDRDGLVQP